MHREELDFWMLFVDGSSTNEGNGVGVVLISLQGEEIKLVVWLHFLVSNNKAIYEALLMGLHTAQNLGAAWVLVLKGAFDIKDQKL